MRREWPLAGLDTWRQPIETLELLFELCPNIYLPWNILHMWHLSHISFVAHFLGRNWNCMPVGLLVKARLFLLSCVADLDQVQNCSDKYVTSYLITNT